MIIVSKDVLDPTVAPFIVADTLVNNSDGSVSLQLPNGRYAGQEPNAYGVRNDNDGIGSYQRFTRQGAILTTQTRPGDALFAYTIAEGQSY